MAGSGSNKLLSEQLFSSPPTVKLEQLTFGDSALRNIAPYALVAAYPNQKKLKFFPYCAVAYEIEEDYACLVFGVSDNVLFPYAGHFIVSKEQIYDPETKKPPDTLKLLPNFEESQYITLFGVLNRDLALYTGYFLHCSSPKYQELFSVSQDSFFAIVNQLKIRFPTEYVLNKEPIKDETMQMIVEQIVPLNATKQKLAESGRFHGQVFLSIRENRKTYSSSGVIDCDQTFDRANRTTFCAAYEAPGCMPFFETSLLLGQLDDFYIVGIYCSNSFSLIATKRIYDRASGERITTIPRETFTSLRLPQWIAEEQTRSYLLDIRRILLHPAKYRKQINIIKEFFNFDDFVPEKPLDRVSKRKPAPKAESERLRNIWIKELLDETFSDSFQNSLLEFPDNAWSADNPNVFGVNIVRLWVQEVLRLVHSKELGELSAVNSPPALEFFMMTIPEFIEKYLPLFGMSLDCTFQCRKIDSHGNPAEICVDNLRTASIGKHVYFHHVAPLLGEHFTHFIPFLLVPPPYVTLVNCFNTSQLEKVRSITRLWEGIPYVNVLKQFRTFSYQLTSESESEEPVSSVLGSTGAEETRKEESVSDDEGSNVSWVISSEKIEEPEQAREKGLSSECEPPPDSDDKPRKSKEYKRRRKSSAEPDSGTRSQISPIVKIEIDTDSEKSGLDSTTSETKTTERRVSKRLRKKEQRKRKRESFEMAVLAKVMKERKVTL